MDIIQKCQWCCYSSPGHGSPGSQTKKSKISIFSLTIAMVDCQSTLTITAKLGNTCFSGLALFYILCERYLLIWASHALSFVGQLLCAKPFLCEVFAQSPGPSSQLQRMAETSLCTSAGDSTSSLKGNIQWKFLHPSPVQMSKTTLPFSAACFFKISSKISGERRHCWNAHFQWD